MLVLGIESTAHTFGAGVVRDGLVLTNERRMYVPPEGGIHPREAADHHVRNGPAVIDDALEKCGVERGDLDLVAFSRGPGLGPCLRIGATMARALALERSIPIVGVNHCVAHLEIGRTLGCTDPVLLYASGGNTQIIAFVKGRYRVLGETLDIGIGNMLDKLGRTMGLQFPAGPKIENLAKGLGPGGEETGDEPPIELLDLPYSVKGMDVSFSGILTAAESMLAKGRSVRSISHSVQEIAFSMLCEVAERAMAHIGATELLLGGGVACNRRLREMASNMAEERGGVSYHPSPGLSVDNGAMIAYLGEVMARAGIAHRIEDTVIDQRFRTDQVEVSWRDVKELGRITTPGTVPIDIGLTPSTGSVVGKGAEAIVTVGEFGDMPSITKERRPKGYRNPALDRRITLARTRNEARMLTAFRSAGIRTPYVLDVAEPCTITMELLAGPRLASVLNVLDPCLQASIVEEIGRITGKAHRNGLVHGDITTSNFILMDKKGPKLGLIDCSLSERTNELEKFGVDLRLFFEVFSSTHQSLCSLETMFKQGYDSENPGSRSVWEKLEEINARGRYLGG